MSVSKKLILSLKSDFDHRSEECCSTCEEIFDTNTITTKCPDCGDLVVSCNACDNLDCVMCHDGNHFNLYGTDRKESKEEPWFNGGKENA